MRLDQSGKGESPLRHDCSGQQSLLIDYDEAYEQFRQTGVEHTALVGLCSGAADAVHIAHERDSVARLVLAAGFAQRSVASVTRYYERQVLSLAPILNRVRRAVGMQDSEELPDAEYADLFHAVWPEWENIRDKYVQILNRDVRMLAVFTRDMEWHYNREGQLARTLCASRGLHNLDEHLIGDSDHTFTATKHRNEFIETVRHWLVSQFPEDKG